jgi:NADH dehydrogenase
MAAMGRGRNATFAIGGPEPMNFDQLIELMMELSGHRRPVVHVPQALMRVAGMLGEMMPRPVFSRDAVDFLLADNPCDNGPLIGEFGIRLTAARAGMSYLKPKA